MIQSLLKKVLTMTKYSFYGLILQCTTMTVLLSYNGTLAQRKSLREIFVSIDIQNGSIADVFQEIEKKTELNFAYNNINLDNKERISLTATNKDLMTLLGEISGKTSLRFHRINDNIHVTRINRKETTVAPPSVSESISRMVTGKVISIEDRSEMSGVNIIVKGTTNGTTTDVNGAYSIEVPDDNTVLVFSFIGYLSQEVIVGAQTVVNISLAADVTTLSELVVVGYGSEKKSDLTGAVSSVRASEMTKLATSDVTQMLQGRVAGVSVTSDGQPGATPVVRIRGIASFGTNGTSTDPLYVVDGVPISGGIRDFSPNDIESMQVLKDASAGAIYGSRAANGVVIITTKRGFKDKPLTIEVNSYYGIQQVAKKIPLTDRANYQLLNNEMRANNPAGTLAPVPGNDPTSPSFISTINTDWQKEAFKTGSIEDHTINFSAGSKTSIYNFSLDYFKNNGTLKGNTPNYQRYSVRMNSESQKGIFKIGESMYLVHSKENPLWHHSDAFGGVDLNEIMRAIPTMPVYDTLRKGGFGGTDAIIQNSISLNVPGMNSLVTNKTEVTRIFTDVYAEAKLIKKNTSSLVYRINAAYDYTVAHDNKFVPEYDLGYFFINTNARVTSGLRQYTTSLLENTLNYETTVGRHSIKLLAGQSFQTFDTYTLSGSSSKLVAPYVPTLSNGTGAKTISENIEQAAIYSIFGRLNYAYHDRYIITANLRRDGSSRISPENRYQVYPSVAVAWKLQNENFLHLPSFITELKLRASWGKVGNQTVPAYAYQPVINQNITYEFGNAVKQFGGASTSFVDRYLKWEERITRNVGIDGTLFNGSLDFTLEYYSNLASNILVSAPIPASTGSLPTGTGGTASILTNAGGMKNSGVELSLTYRKKVGDFTLEVSPNAYTLKNRVTKLNNETAVLTGAGSRTEVGHEIGSHYGWVYEGIFQSADEITSHATQNVFTGVGDVKFKNLDNNSVINDKDRQYLGKSLPSLYYGLNITAKYKNFDLTLFASGSSGNLINNSMYRGLMSSNSYNNYHQDLLNRWTPTHTNTNIPRMVLLDPNNNGRDSNRPGWLEKGNFVRINTFSLGYTLPGGTIKGFTNTRIYVTCQNLYTFTKYKGFNPDFTSSTLNPGFDGGTTTSSFPKPRTYMLGVQLRF